MAYTPPEQVQQAQAAMEADPRVQQARAAYLKTHDQTAFVAYLDAAKPYLAKIDQHQFGLDPATGQINHTSNYGHWWKMAAGMAAGTAPYLAVPGASAATPGITGPTSVTGAAADNIAAASGGGGGIVQKLLGNLPGLLPSIGGLAGSALSQNAGDSPELQAILAQQTQRLHATQPLFENIARMSLDRLPDSARAGFSVPSFDQAEASLPPVKDGNFAQSDALRALLREQQTRQQVAQPVMDAILRLAQSRMPTKYQG